jgi:hypothetical protein
MSNSTAYAVSSLVDPTVRDASHCLNISGPIANAMAYAQELRPAPSNAKAFQSSLAEAQEFCALALGE